jgi:hypothetical protein
LFQNDGDQRRITRTVMTGGVSMECDKAMTRLKQHEVALKRLGVDHLYCKRRHANAGTRFAFPPWLKPDLRSIGNVGNFCHMT